MTHDELLTRIKHYEVQPWSDMPDDKDELASALRAVVELAGKDIEHESYVWLDGYDYAMKQTIQVIEKELR